MLQRTRGIWRLPKLGAEWGIGSTDIRLPPLPPGIPFQDAYQVHPLLSSMAGPTPRVKLQALQMVCSLMQSSTPGRSQSTLTRFLLCDLGRMMCALVIMRGYVTQNTLQVVLVLDQREQFSRSIGGRQHNRVDALSECSRQLSNLGISVEVSPPGYDPRLCCTDNDILHRCIPYCNWVMYGQL